MNLKKERNSNRKKKIKICLISPYIHALYDSKRDIIPFGGKELQFYFLSKEFSKINKFEVNVITGDVDLKKPIIKIFQRIKIHVSLPLKVKRLTILKSYLLLFLTLIRISPDIVLQRVGNINTIICAFYCKIFRKKFIFSIGSDRDVIKNGKKGILKYPYNFGLKTADFIIAQKRTQMESLIRWKRQRMPNLKVIKSSIDIKELKLSQKKDILWVGRATPLKQPEIFLELAKKFPFESFIMICRKGFEPDYWTKIFLEAKKNNNLKFIESVSIQDIEKHFQKSKIFVNTSTREGFPNTFLQALKSKTPIISLNVDPDNFLSINECGFHCKNDFNLMIENVELLLTDKDLYSQYSYNSHDYVKRNHDITKNSKEWINLFKKIMQIENNFNS